MDYRAEIDGLRAVAVIPVMLFHAGFTTFSGGYVGVDVFFVISGYLITSIILSDLERNKFSIVSFYERRARRILPALFLVMAACVPFAVAWLTHRDMRDFAQSVIAVSTFSSNILFWIESGYFDTTAELKPLLHTWSLAVEEQFYILFPLVLTLGWRLRRRNLIAIFLLVFAGSLAAAHMLPIHFSNPKVASGVFFLAPTRAWELLLGAFAAFYLISHDKIPTPPLVNNLLAALGLAMITYAVFVFDKSTPFPGLYALVPTVGTILIILFAFKQTIIARILSAKALVGIGLISYSAYLWHQPLFAFAKYRSLNPPSSLAMSALLVVSILLAFLSWKYVEIPFRKRTLLTRDFIFKLSTAAAASFVFFGIFIQQQSGLPAYAGDGLRGNEGELSSDTQFLLYGDSHARQYYNSLTMQFGDVKMITLAGCMSLPDIVNQGSRTRHDCIEKVDLLRNAMSRGDEDLTLVLSYRWTKNLVELSSNRVIGAPTETNALKRLIVSLEEIIDEVVQDKSMIIIGNVPSAHAAGEYMREGYERCMSFVSSNCPTSYPMEGGEAIPINNELADFASRHDNVTFVNPYDGLCDGTKCFILSDGVLLYSDHSHLTEAGAGKVIDTISNISAQKQGKS